MKTSKERCSYYPTKTRNLGRRVFISVIVAILSISFLLLNLPAFANTEEKITVPINQVVKTSKLSAEQLAKSKVTVPRSWVDQEYLKEHFPKEEDSSESATPDIEPPGKDFNNIPDGTLTASPKITSEQSDDIDISDFNFEFTYDQGELKKSEINFTVKSEAGKIEAVKLVLEGEKKLVPTDGAYDESEEVFSQSFIRLEEGNLYEGQLEIKAGEGSDKVKFQIYPRMYLNIADEDEINIGAAYYIWYDNPGNWHIFSKKPKVGTYSSENDEIIAKHIDWATGHGIDFFLTSWDKFFRGKDEKDERLKNFLENPIADDIKYALLLESDNLNDRWKPEDDEVLDFSDDRFGRKFERTFKYTIENYFGDDNYFKIDGEPLVYLWNHPLFSGPFEEVMNQIDQKSKSRLGEEIYWVGQNLVPTPHNSDLIQSTDGTAYYMPMYRLLREEGEYTLSENLLANWFKPYVRRKYFASQDLGVDYIPEIVPGEEKAGSDLAAIKRNPEGFKKEIEMARNLIDSDIRTIFIISFNEWPEATSVEPGRGWDKKYLEIIKNELAGYEPNEELIDNMDRIELKFNKSVIPESGHPRKLAAAFDWAKFSDSARSMVSDLKIDIGTVEGSNYMGSGWFYYPEPSEDLKDEPTIAFAGGSRKKSSIYVPKEIDAEFMKIKADTAWPEIEADVYFNGSKVGHIDFKKGMHEYTIKLVR